MNPGIVSAAVVVVGAIAAALFYVFNEPPQAQSHGNRNRNRNRDNVYNYHFNTISTNNYYPSDGSKNSENESRNRKKRRQVDCNDICGICLEHLAGASGLIEILECDHAFHAKCLDDYSESQKSIGFEFRCPLCRHLIE